MKVKLNRRGTVVHLVEGHKTLCGRKLEKDGYQFRQVRYVVSCQLCERIRRKALPGKEKEANNG